MQRENRTDDFTEITPENCCELFDAPVITELTFNNDPAYRGFWVTIDLHCYCGLKKCETVVSITDSAGNWWTWQPHDTIKETKATFAGCPKQRVFSYAWGDPILKNLFVGAGFPQHGQFMGPLPGGRTRIDDMKVRVVTKTTRCCDDGPRKQDEHDETHTFPGLH